MTHFNQTIKIKKGEPISLFFNKTKATLRHLVLTKGKKKKRNVIPNHKNKKQTIQKSKTLHRISKK